MKRFFPIAGYLVVVAFIVSGLWVFSPKERAQASMDGAANTLVVQSRDGKRHNFTIELALTKQEQAKGLMNRTEMAADHGMLFLFAKEQEISFWMKNTLIPLDMIFIKKDGRIHRIQDSAKPLDLTGVPSNGPVLAVLELNGGTAQRLGIVAGDRIKHPFFP